MQEVTERFGMQHRLLYGDRQKRVALFVSKYDHCLYDLLLRHRAKELTCEIALVVSNHPISSLVAQSFGVPFVLSPKDPTNKVEQEQRAMALLLEHDVDLVVLARYMQVLGEEFVTRFQNRVINIHHSFLPAFVGGKPYHQAHDRGVKLIGVTAHYATRTLDEGPIIEQDVVRCSHRDSVEDLIRKGRDLEEGGARARGALSPRRSRARVRQQDGGLRLRGCGLSLRSQRRAPTRAKPISSSLKSIAEGTAM